MKRSFNMVFLLAFPMIFGIISVSKAFVPIFFGAGYDKVATLMSVISPIILLIGLSNVTGTQYLLPTKRQKEYTVSVIIGAITNFAMNMCLIWKFGAVGASIGTVIAEFTVTAVQLYFVKNDFDFKEMLKISRNYIISSLIMFIICIFIRTIILDNLLSILLQVVLGGMTYGVCLLMLKDKFVYEMIEKINGKVLRKK